MDATTALTPAAAASAYIPKTCVTGKGAIVTGTAASTPTALGVGTDGQILTACSTATEGLCWATPPAPAIPCACILAKGDLITGTAANTPIALTVGTDGQLLAACSACTTGLTWVAPPAAATPTVAGIVLGCTTVSNTALGCNALLSLGAGTLNVALGTCAGCAITTGSQNVALGPNAAVTSATGSCQLAIGFSATDNWLIGDCDKNIKPGAGIRDCANSLGTAGQVLCSTGTAIQWASPSGGVFSAGLTGSAIVGADQQLVPYWAFAFTKNSAGFAIGTAFNGCASAAIFAPIGCQLRIDYSLTTSLCSPSSAGAGVDITSSIVNNGTGLALANSLSYWRASTSGTSNTSNQMSQAFYFTTSAGNCSFAMQINKSTPPGWTWITYSGFGNWNFTILN